MMLTATCVANPKLERSLIVSLASHDIHCNTPVPLGAGITYNEFTAIRI